MAKKKIFNFNLFFRRLHKWLALVVGLQLVLWTLSGFLMSYVPIEEVHGDHLWDKKAKLKAIDHSKVTYSLNSLMAQYEGRKITYVKVLQRLDRVIYEVRNSGESFYHDAVSGELLQPIGESKAIEVAQKAYRWTGKYKSIEYVTGPNQYGEIRGRPYPIWKVNFADDVNSSLYVSPKTAQVITVRSDIWRQYDFFWMLHIMDYDTRDDFNNWLLILAASVAFFIAITGVLLFFYAFSKKDFRWIRQ